MNHQLSLGRLRRDAALNMFEVKAREWLTLARNTAVLICREKGTTTMDEVKERIGEPPDYVHPNAAGAVFKGKQFERVGVVASKRARNNASIISVWRLR